MAVPDNLLWIGLMREILRYDTKTNLASDEVLVLAELMDDPSQPKATVIIGDEQFYIDRSAIVFRGKR